MVDDKVRFSEDQSTNLATLYGRARDACRHDPILGDDAAAEAVGRIDYDFGKFKVREEQILGIAARARVFDDWARGFLRDHRQAIVLHLGCGMDSRVFRLDPPSTVQWFDVDYPSVIELRRQVYPQRANYRMISSSVTDLGWISEVPADRPTLVIAEGLTMYLDPANGRSLLRQLASTFPGGEIQFDCYSRAGIKLQKLNRVVRRAGATLRWGVDDPRELERLGLLLVQKMGAADFATSRMLVRMTPAMRARMRLACAIPFLRNMGFLLRYRF